MKTLMRRLTAAGCAMALFAGTHHAMAITIDGTTFFNSTSSPVIGNFDASGSDKLVVVVTGEHGFPNNAGGDAISITYDGVELTKAVERDPVILVEDPLDVDQTYNDIWYLDNPTTSGGVIELTAQTRGNVTVFGLSGTAPGVGATAVSGIDSKSVDITTIGSDSLVIVSHGMGGDGNTANVNSVTADAPLTFVSAQENGNIWDGHVVAYENGVSAGTQTYSFTGGNTVGTHVIAAAFLATGGPAVPGDTDGDGDIDDTDLGTSFSNYTGPVGAAGGKTASEGDTDGDGDVDDTDLGTSFSGYTGPLGPASVPEPTSLALLGLGGLLIARRRR